MTDLIYHVTLQDHMIKGSSDLMEGSSFIECNSPALLGDHRHCGSGDNVFNLSRDLT